jgi:hypothetical protein
MLKKLLLVLGFAAAAIAAAPKRDWKTGTLTQTAFATQDVGAHATAMSFPEWGSYAPSMSMATARRIQQTYEGFRIETVDYLFVVACRFGPRHRPNVTVNGPIKYAIEKGRFYILDGDGREFEMLVLQKSAPAAANAGDPGRVPTELGPRSAEQMLSFCGPVVRAKINPGNAVSLPPTYEVGECWGAFRTLTALVKIVDDKTGVPLLRHCLPDEVTVSQVAAMFSAYTQNHPELYHESYILVAMKAIREMFPCAASH